jgi:hypothetical protein
MHCIPSAHYFTPLLPLYLSPVLSVHCLSLPPTPLLTQDINSSSPFRYPARARFDRARDRYITAKGYDILRLQLIGRSIDDLVSQIKDKVDEKTEQFQDRQIQQIYAVDASSLYTPEAARKVYSPRKNIKSD